MAGVRYIAKTGIDFNDLRVEAGDPIPEISQAEIQELLAIGAVEEEGVEH